LVGDAVAFGCAFDGVKEFAWESHVDAGFFGGEFKSRRLEAREVELCKVAVGDERFGLPVSLQSRQFGEGLGFALHNA